MINFFAPALKGSLTVPSLQKHGRTVLSSDALLSPCCVQLTRFQGDGGYAVGVSCSLMLCDPVSLARFLLSWARTHAEIKARSKARAP